MVFILIALFTASAVRSTSDTYWHLAIGRQTWQTHQIPKTDPFVYSQKDTRFTSTEWLAGLTFYAMEKYLHQYGIVSLRITTILLISTLLLKTLSLVRRNWILTSASVLSVAYSLSYRFYDRPENFSYLFIAFILYLLFYFLIKRKNSNFIYILPPIFTVWPNIHAFSLVGLYLLAIYLVIDLKRNLQKPTIFKFIFLLCLLPLIIQYK